MTALTLYPNNVASSLSTANKLLENPSTGATAVNLNTNLTSGTTGWVELWSQGDASAQTGAGSQPSPSNHGWLEDTTLIEGNHFQSGTWTWTVELETTTTGTFTCDIHCRAYQRSSGGTYTLIAEGIATSQTIISTAYTQFTVTASGASASNTFATGDKTYTDVTLNITTNSTTGNVRVHMSSSSTLGYTSVSITTPGYISTTTSTRTIPAAIALVSTPIRTIPANASLLAPTSIRTIPASASLIFTSTRAIPASASLQTSAVFYASNVASAIGGLTQSDQMSQVSGGTETSFTVTAPSSGTNAYVELTSQGGTPGSTSALPAPTGKGWSISLAGNTIVAGSWSGIFTLSKSGTSMSGGAVYARWSRRTMDGTYYPIAISSITSQTFSTTKTTYTLPSVLASLWQFVAGDTLYMDAFVLNTTTAWASNVFTIYVSNSASQGVYNDGTTIAPTMISTPAGLSNLVGASSFQSGSGAPVRDQSFTLADALDQRSILTLTVEDTAGTLSYQRGMPVMFSDSNQGLLYTGYVNSDKVSKPAAGGAAQLEHQLTIMDHHYDVDKRANETNYLNWTAGDMVCDFAQQTLSQEGITGAFALESDYTPATFGQGTLSGTVATTTTTPFVYAPNTATPPITSNTGDLELVRAGTQFMLTESVTSDFSSGTLTNMTASNNMLTPTTQSALKLEALLSPVATAQNQISQEGTSGASSPFTGTATSGEYFANLAYIRIWSGSMTVGTNDTFNYDFWISSTSPEFLAGMDIEFSDKSFLSDHIGTLCLNNSVAIYDQNGVSVDCLQDLSGHAKDTWYTRNITLTGLNGKTITAVDIFLAGSSSGTYTVYGKNCYLGSQSGSPFFGVSATAPQLNPPLLQSVFGGYVSNSITTSVVQVYDPLGSYRISPAHSLSGVGLVQNSNITWTASLPTSGAPQVTYPPGTTAATTSSGGGISPGMVLFASYDNTTWLTCQNSQALPGLPAGGNVSGLSFYLREQFACGSDPSAIPSLEQVQITINSAAAQTVSDIVTTYGTSTEWNTGTQLLIGPNSNGDLTLTGTANAIASSWSGTPSLSLQSFFAGFANSGTQAASGGVYSMTPGANSGTNPLGTWCQSRFDFAGYILDGTIEADIKLSTSSFYCDTGIIYRQTGWGNANYHMAYYVAISQANTLVVGFSDNSWNNSTVGSFTNIAQVTKTIAANTYYHIKLVVKGNRHTVYFNHSSTPDIDVLDNTYLSAGQVGFRCATNTTNSFTASIENFSILASTSGIWTSPSTSLASLGTCGYNQVCWSDLDGTGHPETAAIVLASIDNGSSWLQCTNGAEIPQLSRGTTVSSVNLVFQIILSSSKPPISTPIIMGLYARVCGNYGTVSGTRISPALSLSPVGYVSSNNVAWNANIPTNTSLTVQTTQDLSTYHTVGNNGAGEALTYWANQPASTQDLFNSNTSASYTNISKSGGSAATVTYDTTNSRITLSGGSGGLYVNNSISTSDVDLLCDMDESDAGGLVWREVSTTNYYELGVYDASSSGGFTNQLRLYKVASGTRSLIGSASTITFTRGTFHRIRVTMQGGLISVYWDGTCKQSYLDTSALGSGECGLRNDGGTSRYYQLWIQPLGSNLTGQVLYTKVTMTTSDPSMMPQLFTLVACVRGPSIGTGATVSQLHPITTPFAAYYSSEMDNLVQMSGDYYWYVDKWRQLHFGPRLARPGAFPVQSVADPANSSGYLLYLPQVTVLSSADIFRNEQVITGVTGLVSPPTEIKVADGSTTSWTLGYPVYSAPTILVNGQGATVGYQGVDNNRQFYWQPLSSSISYDSTLPKLPAGTILSFTYVGTSSVNVNLENSGSQAAQAALEGNSGIVAQIQTALNSTASGMTTDQATAFGNGLLTRYGSNSTIELVGTTLYAGLAPGTTVGLMLPEIMSIFNSQVPIVKVTTTGYQGQNGIIYLYSVDATTGPNLTNYARVWF